MGENVIFSTVKRNLITKRRAYPFEFFLGNLINCVLLVLNSYFIFKILFGGNITKEFIEYTDTSDYMSFSIIGCFIFMFVVGAVFNVSRSFISEIRQGTLESILITNMSPIYYLIGNMVEQLIIISFELFVAFLLCIPFGLNLENINITSTLIYMSITIFGTFGMIILLCGTMIYFKDTFIIQNTAFALLALLCGTSFPIDYLPSGLQLISHIIPITYSMELIRGSIINGENISSHLSELTMLAAISILYCIVGALFIGKVLKKAVINHYI